MTADGKTILITGATDGIGRLTALGLASQGAAVVIHGRDPQRLDQLATAITAHGGRPPAATVVADLASLDQIRRAADQVAGAVDRLDVLINNAGIGTGPRGAQTRELSADGIELRFQVNALAPFLLSRRLEPFLVRPDAAEPARIVNVASVAQAPIDFDDVMLAHGYDGMRAYSQSKLALVMITFEQAARLAGRGVVANALHPGTLLDTKMVHEGFGAARGSAESGAIAEQRLALDPAFGRVTGVYIDVDSEARAHDQAYDVEARRRLWGLAAELCGIEP